MSRRWGFGAAFLDALHESRRRQAAREIHEYRHLIDEVKAREVWRAIELSHLKASQAKTSAGTGGRRSARGSSLVMRAADYMRTLIQAIRLSVLQQTTASRLAERIKGGQSS